MAAGRIGSIDEAVRLAVNLIMPVDTTDLSWAKPYLDEARAQLRRGEFVEHGDFKRELAERVKVLRRQGRWRV